MNALTSTTFSPPSIKSLHKISGLIPFGPFQIKVYSVLFIDDMKCCGGMGSEINRWFNVDIRSVFMTVIFPIGVRIFFPSGFYTV